MKHIAKRRIKNTAQMLAVLGLVGMSTFAFNASAQDIQTSVNPENTQTMHSYTVHQKTPLTDAQKATLKEAKALRDAGKKDEAKALLEKAGIKKHMMHKHHKHQKHTQSINSNTTTK